MGRRIPVGAHVVWDSHGRCGRRIVKSGKVVGFIPAGRSVLLLMPGSLPTLPRGVRDRSRWDRYLVRVTRGVREKVVYYSPSARLLEHQNPGRVQDDARELTQDALRMDDPLFRPRR